MRSHMKAALNLIFFLLNLPLLAVYFLFLPWVDSDSLFAGFSQFYALFPGKTGVYIRRNFYRLVLPHFGQNITIGFGTVLSHRETIIGDNVYIGPQCNIGMCHIEPECLIGSGVHILSGRHQHNFSDPDKPLREQGGQYTSITIGENSWIGNCAVIMDDVAPRSVIGAAALVVKTEGSGIYLGHAAKRFNDSSSSDSPSS